MKQLNFKYISCEQFFCFKKFELDLTKLGNIVLITGENRDVGDTDPESSRNGIGKSTVPDIIVWTLFGKSLKGVKHDRVVNKVAKKGLRGEVHWDNFKVIRTRSPDSLKLWKLEDEVWVEKTLGGMPATQKLIEDEIGMNFNTFCKIFVFTDDSRDTFLESDTPTKRDMTENLLSLEKYIAYQDKAKELLKELKAKIAKLTKEYEFLNSNLDNSRTRLSNFKIKESNWKTEKVKEIELLKQKIVSKTNELSNTDIGNLLVEYKKAQDDIVVLNYNITDMETKKAKSESLIPPVEAKLREYKNNRNELEDKLQTVKLEVSRALQDIKTINSKINDLKSKSETRCHECYGQVTSENVDTYNLMAGNKIVHNEGVVNSGRQNIDFITQEIDKINNQMQKTEAILKVAKEKIAEQEEKLRTSRKEVVRLNRIEKPELSVNEQLLQGQIAELEKQIVQKTNESKGNGPYFDLILDTEKEIEDGKLGVENKKKEISTLEDELPYYTFWVTAFGDAGIRKWVVDGIIPALNSRIAYWLQFLINGKIQLSFDNKLEESISRIPNDGDPYVYAQMSKGEKQRLNLTVSQAWAHIMMLNTGVMPSCVWLDEVATNIDQSGVIGIFNMIQELSKDRQVFVTTHDETLIEMLKDKEVIHLVKKNGITEKSS